MEFEYGSLKSARNKEKHGIDFIEAQELWLDSNSIGFPARSEDEERFALLAQLRGKFWVAFYTVRGDKIRLISVRRARDGELQLYES